MKAVETLREDAKQIFHAGLQAVDAKAAVRRTLQHSDELLLIDGHSYDLSGFEHIYVVGAGKAGAAMASAVEEILGERISAGHVNVKYGHTLPLEKVTLHEAGHPIPDEAGLRGAEAIVALLEQAGEKDLVICLISGGGSALLPLPAAGISLRQKQEVTQRLLSCGAAITEINAVRKHISQIKGGQLCRCAWPATLVALILSDVVGDPLDAIASGPTVPDATTFQDVRDILTRYGVWDSIPAAVRNHVQRGVDGEIPETPKSGDRVFERSDSTIIASNFLAVMAARQAAEQLGYATLVLSTMIEGETRDVAKVHAAVAKEIIRSGHPVAAPACVISGGETTVTIRGQGKGGRNQEFVLAAAIEIADLPGVVLLSAGTDGTDGPTDAAGALCDGRTVRRAAEAGMRAQDYLAENNAYPFFAGLNDLLITGPTHTNVMDLRVILVTRD